MVEAYSLFNPHATLTVRIGQTQTDFPRSSQACAKWVASEPTSPHWYTVEQLRALACAYITAERNGARPRTVREFISEFRGLSGTAKQKSILATLPVSGVHLRDLVKNGDVDHKAITALLQAMQHESRPVKPAALGVLGEEYLTAWLNQQPGGATTVTYTKTAGIDDEFCRPFVVETAFGVRQDNKEMRLVTGINWAPTLVDPFRALNDCGLTPTPQAGAHDGVGRCRDGYRPGRSKKWEGGMIRAFQIAGAVRLNTLAIVPDGQMREERER